MAILVFKVSGEIMTKFCQDTDLCQKVKPDRFSIALTHKSLSGWSQIMKNLKAE
jgi:hypothetical protein